MLNCERVVSDALCVVECCFQNASQAFVVPGESSVQVVLMCRDVGKKKKDESIKTKEIK